MEGLRHSGLGDRSDQLESLRPAAGDRNGGAQRRHDLRLADRQGARIRRRSSGRTRRSPLGFGFWVSLSTTAACANAREHQPAAGLERQHGLGNELARRRSVPPAAERGIRGLLDAQPAALDRGSQRLSLGRHPVPGGFQGRGVRGRRVARALQVLRWRTDVAEHAAPRLPAGSVAGGQCLPERPGPRARSGLRRGSRSRRAGGRRRPLPLRGHRLQSPDGPRRQSHGGALFVAHVHRPQQQGKRGRDAVDGSHPLSSA